MKPRQTYLTSRSLSVFILLLATIVTARSQSHVLDAKIEGFVTDLNGAAVPTATVSAINTDTGAHWTTTSNESGIYRFPILSPGKYSLVVEHPGFKRFERHGIILSAGQTATVSILLEPGNPQEIVTITSDSAITDPAKFEIGNQINTRDIKNLPLVSRNPFNFVLLLPGTTGRRVTNPAAIPLSSNGLMRRAGYLLDGGYNNDADVGGFRLSFVSEVFIKEVQVLGSGYSVEFGNTAGMVVNVITRSGTNDLDGTLALLYRPAELASKPFGFKSGDPDPNLNASGFTAAIGGPIIKDRWHFYSAYERTRRTDSKPITVSEENRRALVGVGLPASIFLNSTHTVDTLPYFIFRTDAIINRSTRLSVRYNRFDAGLAHTGVGGLNSTQQSFGLDGWDHALAGQAITTLSNTFFNEFYFQRIHRLATINPNEQSSTGLTIDITNAAVFGRNPEIGAIDTNLTTTQLQDSVTKIYERHSLKIGGSVNVLHDNTLQAHVTQYTFPNVEAYVNAVSGINRRSYSNYTETFGDPSSPFGSLFSNAFVLDDWNVASRLKVTGGLRYDLYRPPKAEPNSPLPMSRSFRTDRNNFAPRLGIAYLRDGKYQTVVRTGSGIYYDPPFLRMYRRAKRNNGDQRFFSFGFASGDVGAPNFPNTLGMFPAEASIPRRNVDAVSADFKTMYASHSNLQVEQTVMENMSITLGYLFSVARHIPVYRNVNCRPVGETLADGRPVYGTIKRVTDSGMVQIETCTQPIYAEFRQVNMVESSGNLTYHGLFIQLAKRFSNGVQANASYTFSRAQDDAPEDNGPSATKQSDPSNREIDRGPAWGDVRHTLRLNMIVRPQLNFSNEFLNWLMNNNQLGVIAFADSGEDSNIVADFDLNRDGVGGGKGPDRPVGVSRNALRLPPFFNLDVRFSRFISLRPNISLEVYAEASNVFNGKYVSSYNGTALPSNNVFTSLVNPVTGELRGPVPRSNDAQANWRESRQIQLGLRFHF
jgi:hypothetical protein